MDYAGAAYIFERNDSGNWNEVQKLVASDRAANDYFGLSVSISGNYAIIGAMCEDEDAIGGNTLTSAGSAYIFERNGYGNWNEVQKIVPSDRAAGDGFGNSVGISANYTIIGAEGEDEDTLGGNTLISAGSAYIFERDENGNWNELQKLVAHDRSATDYFGYSISISCDYAVVGATYEDEDNLGQNTMNDAGSAYIFEHKESGHWKEVQKIVASDRDTDDLFAYRVSISNKYLIVSTYKESEDELGENTLTNAGSAYIFERDENGNWNEVQKIVASDRAIGDAFGSSVDISGNYALVGAYTEDEDESGENTLNQAGSTYLFERSTDGFWDEVQKLVASDRSENKNFGVSLGISGNYAIIGNCYEVPISNGSVYIFESCTPGSVIDPDNILENGDFESCILSPWSLFYGDYIGFKNY
jgi:hypothetical protein